MYRHWKRGILQSRFDIDQVVLKMPFVARHVTKDNRMNTNTGQIMSRITRLNNLILYYEFLLLVCKVDESR